MRKFVSLILRVAIVSVVAVWLAREPGTVRIVWHGSIVETSAALLGVAVLAFGVSFYMAARLWHALRHGPGLWRLHRRHHHAQEGLKLLTHGLVAIAGGDAAEAGRLALQARKRLGVTPATRLLQAQAAQLAGDDAVARNLYRAMTDDPDSAILGYRGLIMDARRRQAYDEVRELADALHKLKPSTPWLDLIRFEIAARQQKWDEAGTLLAAPSIPQLVGPQKAKKLRAAVLLTRALDDARQGSADQALQAAEQAARQAPDWLPAILTLARCQLAADQRRAAYRTIEKNWGRMPHPQLAALYHAEGEDPVAGYKRTRNLCRADDEAAASHLALGAAALEADLWGEARRHLVTLIGHGEATQGAFRLMARLERRESGNEQAALQWLTKAADAAPDPVWLCSSCGGSHAEWQPSCDHCHGFATLEWQSPGVSRRTISDSTHQELDLAGLVSD